jgi:hypothetical protein
VTSRTWTVLDHLGTLDQRTAVALADRAVQRGWLRPIDIASRLAAHPGRNGNVALRRLVEALSDGAAAESERILHRLLRHSGLTGWRANFDVWLDGELIAVIDVAFPRLRIAIEVDGHAYHSDVEQFRRDRQQRGDLGRNCPPGEHLRP